MDSAARGEEEGGDVIIEPRAVAALLFPPWI
jgi:hypothetical protein